MPAAAKCAWGMPVIPALRPPPHPAGPARAAVAWRAAIPLLNPAAATPPEGAVDSWHDGDTVRVLLARSQETVRLIGIDAPDTGQRPRQEPGSRSVAA